MLDLTTAETRVHFQGLWWWIYCGESGIGARFIQTLSCSLPLQQTCDTTGWKVGLISMHPASAAFRGALRRLHEGVPYCGVSCVCGMHVNVFSYTAVRKLLPSLRQFSWKPQMLSNIMCGSLTKIEPKSDNKCGKKGRSAFTCQVKQAFTAPGFTKITLLNSISQDQFFWGSLKSVNKGAEWSCIV